MKVLVVANQTLGGEALLDALRERVRAGDCRIKVLVPASSTPGGHAHAHDEDRRDAYARLSAALERFGELGCAVEGDVGDFQPYESVLDALREDPEIDEVLLSTLPPGASRWLRMDLPSRLERAVGVPITHVVARAESPGG